MPHLKINSHFGRNPLLTHTPRTCLHLPKTPNLLTIGSNGDCVIWQSPTSPLFVMIPSLNHQSGSLVCCSIVNTSNLVDETCLKLLTVHEGNRLRMWKLDDGICVNITGFDAFEENIVGGCSDVAETRFVFLHSDFSLYVFDCWKMAVAARVKLDIKISKLYREVLDGKEVVIIRDSLRKNYVWDASEILREKWADFKNIISNNIKTFQELKNLQIKLQENLTLVECRESGKEILIEDPEALKEISMFLQKQQNNEIEELFNPHFSRKFPQILCSLKRQQQITQSCMVFLNHCTPYLFLGCRSGRLYAVPVFYDNRKPKAVILLDEHAELGESEIRYLNTKKNSLIVSYRNGCFRIFSLEMMELAIQSQLKSKKDNPKEQLLSIPLTRFKNMEGRLSSPIKYLVQTHRIPFCSDQTPADNYLAFELENKEVVCIQIKDKTITNMRGASKELKIFGVLLFDGYYGVATQFGINIYRFDSSYDRSIKYDSWNWRDYNLHKKTDIEWDYNNYKTYKRSNQNNYLVNFSNRYLTHTLNYFDPKYGIFYQTFGAADENAIDNDHYAEFYFFGKAHCESLIHSRNVTSSMSILKLRSDRQRRQSWNNTSYILHTDAKRQVEKVFGQVSQSQPSPCETLNSFNLLFPWQHDPQLTSCLTPYLGNNVPCLQNLLAFQGISTSFTIYLQPALTFCLSPFLTSYSALSIMLYLITICNRDNTITDTMFKCVEYFTIKKPAQNKSLSLTQLAQLSIEGNNHVVNAGCNLMISGMLGREVDLAKIEEYFILNLKHLEETKSKVLSHIEIYWMLVIGFAYIYSAGEPVPQKKDILINRLISAIDVVNFEMAPDLVAINLKILNEGIDKWKTIIQPNRAYNILNTLFVLFFFYDSLPQIPREDRKLNITLDTSDPLLNKRMKHIIVKTVVYLANQYTNEFLQLLKKQSVNQQLHPMYPCSVIQILRQYLKSQRPTRHLVFYIQLLLKCISPTTPQLRKYVQKNVTQTLYHLCTYKNISFNQPSQKIALLSSNHIFIYDLRTATKWRTIDIDSGEGVDFVVEMSPKGNYVAALGRELKIWRLSSSFWSGVLGAFSQGWTFQAQGRGLKWEETEASITVEAAVPNNNRVFML